MFERILKFGIFRQCRIFKNSDANFIYLMYLLAGGVVSESKVRTQTKCLYYLISLICCIYLVITTAPCIYYEFVKSDAWDLVYILTAAQFAFLPYCVVATEILIGFVYRNILTHAIRQIDDEFYVDWKRIDKRAKQYEAAAAAATTVPKSRENSARSNLEKRLSIIASTSGILTIIFVSVRYIWAYAIGFDKVFDNYYYYIGPVVGGEKIDSLAEYTAYTLGHAIVVVLIMVKTTALTLFFISLAGIYCDKFIELARIMDADSILVRQSIESIKKRRYEYLEIDQMSIEISFSFRKRCCDYLQAYRKIRTASEYLRPYVEIYFMTAAILNIVYLTSTVYIFTQKTVPVVFKIAVAVLFTISGSLLFGPCFVGKQFYIANEIMINTVYDTPWYYLQNTERKMIYLFLCEVQNSPTKFTGFLIYPISMMTFPKMLIIYYKIVNIMRKFYSKN